MSFFLFPLLPCLLSEDVVQASLDDCPSVPSCFPLWEVIWFSIFFFPFFSNVFPLIFLLSFLVGIGDRNYPANKKILPFFLFQLLLQWLFPLFSSPELRRRCSRSLPPSFPSCEIASPHVIKPVVQQRSQFIFSSLRILSSILGSSWDVGSRSFPLFFFFACSSLRCVSWVSWWWPFSPIISSLLYIPWEQGFPPPFFFKRGSIFFFLFSNEI